MELASCLQLLSPLRLSLQALLLQRRSLQRAAARQRPRAVALAAAVAVEALGRPAPRAARALEELAEARRLLLQQLLLQALLLPPLPARLL